MRELARIIRGSEKMPAGRNTLTRSPSEGKLKKHPRLRFALGVGPGYSDPLAHRMNDGIARRTRSIKPGLPSASVDGDDSGFFGT